MKEEYNKLKKKFKLPDFDKLNDEFEISDIDYTDFLLRDIRRKMTEKLDFHSKILESIIQPETNGICLFECKVFDDEEKAEIYELFKIIMFYIRLSTEVSLECDDQKDADFIFKLFENWKGLKIKLKEKIVELRKSWQKKSDIKEKLEYFG